MAVDATREGRPVELIDYLVVLWRWKVLIVVGTLACVAVVALASVLQPPRTSTATARIVLPDVGDQRGKDLERFVARITAGYLTGEPVAGLVVQHRRPLVLDLELPTDVPSEGAQKLGAVAERIVRELNDLVKLDVEDHEAMVAGARIQAERAMAEQQFLEQRLPELRRSLDGLRRSRARAAQSDTSAVQALALAQLANEISRREAEIFDVERRVTLELPAQIKDLQRVAASLGRRGARITLAVLTGPPTVAQPSVVPRLKRNMAVGLVTGLLGFVVLAFLVEYVRQAGAERLRPAHGRP